MAIGSRFLVGLDVGTGVVKAAVVQEEHGRPRLIAVFRERSSGVRKGAVVELTEATTAISRVLAEVKKIAKPALKTVYVNVGTPQTKVQHSHGVVAVSRADGEIYTDDIERVVKSSQAVTMGPNRMVLHTVTREYVVDGVGDIGDPLGLSGNRLEVHSILIDAFAPHVRGLIRVVELAGAKIGGMVFMPLAAARSALTKNQRDLGVVVIDIGFGTTGVAIYEENKLSGVSLFPVGAGNVTNDIAVGLRIPVDAAEEIKLRYGYALAKDISQKESIDLVKLVPDAKGSVSRRFVAEIVESRLAEIFEFVNNELKLLGKAGGLPGGAVLIGGGAKIPGITGLATQELKLSSHVGVALEDEWDPQSRASFPDAFEDPDFVSVLGLALWGAEQEGWKAKGGMSWKGIKHFARYFLP